jgi:hypothetical protein
MSRQKISLNTLSGPDSRDLSVRYPADRIRVSAWFCQNPSEVPACYLGITRGRVRPFYLPVLPMYGFTKLYTNPFLIIYLLPNFKLPVLVLFWGLEQKKLNSGSHTERTPQAQRRERRGQSLPRWHFSVVWEHEGVGVAVTAVKWVARKWASNPSRRTCLQYSGSARPRRRLLLLQSRGSFWLRQVEVVVWQASAAGLGLVAILLLRLRETGDMGH